MARKTPMPVVLTSYPQSNTCDGVDTARVSGREGYQKQLGKRFNSHTSWHDSETGERTEAPEYARDYDY